MNSLLLLRRLSASLVLCVPAYGFGHTADHGNPAPSSASSLPAQGHAGGHGSKVHRASGATSVAKTPFGQRGDPARASRTVRVELRDTMRFSPAVLQVRRGETLRLSLHNTGQVVHEFVLGTPQDIHQHRELMKRNPSMAHDEPHMVHVSPGRSGELVWQFTEAGEFEFACLMPGHFEAGMFGRVIVQ